MFQLHMPHLSSSMATYEQKSVKIGIAYVELKAIPLPPHDFSLFFTARKYFQKVLFLAASVFLMFAGTLSLEWFNGSQPNFHTRRGGMACTLFKIGVEGLTVW